MSEYWTMKEMGKELGLTSHQVGRRLKTLGLRTAAGRPSPEAFQGGYCAQRWTQDQQHYLWAWHAENTLQLLANQTGESNTGAPASNNARPQ
jgi:hypothetical protein